MSSSNPLLDLLVPKLADRLAKTTQGESSPGTSVSPNDTVQAVLLDTLCSTYLSRLASLPLSSIVTTEPASLQSSSQSLKASIQSLSSRSHKALIASSQNLSTLSASIDALQRSIAVLSSPPPQAAIGAAAGGSRSIPSFDRSIQTFIQTFHKDAPAIHGRSLAHLLSHNLDRVLDILELPTLLSSAISSGNYPTSLDILAHVRRLTTLYPACETVASISKECETLQRTMVTNLIRSLRGAVKLPMAMKTVGWLRRAAPEMNENEDVTRAVFLVCRLAWVEGLFQALEPLRELADEEREQRIMDEEKEKGKGGKAEARRGMGEEGYIGTATRGLSSRRDGGTLGQHTERYLKRWIEIFREQSFAVVSMYRSIFPTTLTTPTTDSNPDNIELGPPPPPLSTFVLHLISLLEDTLKFYLPNIYDKSARESLLTQVLYAAGSLGRLGGDFSGVVSCLWLEWDGDEDGDAGDGGEGKIYNGGAGHIGVGAGEGDTDGGGGGGGGGGDIVVEQGEQQGQHEEEKEEEEEEEEEEEDGIEEWVEVMMKHRVLASKLEQLAAGGR